MKRKQVLNKFVFLLFLCVCSSLIYTEVHAKTTEKRSVDLHGRWTEDKRSISSNISLEAYIENDNLIIQSKTLRSDITIQITDPTCLTVFNDIVLGSNTGFISISLENLKNGIYSLNLKNQWGGLLYAEFSIR